MERTGKGQTAPYEQGAIDLTSKQAVEAADRKRFQFVNRIVSKVEKRKVFTKDKNYQDKIDDIITHPVVGLPIFAMVMFLVFQISQAWVGPWIAEGFEFENGFAIPGLVTLIDGFKEWIVALLEGANANAFLTALLTEGIIGGVSAVVGFLPLVMVMYFLIALLEDCGYMARATVVLDPIFKKVGLSGKSVIPFVIGTGCAIPGVMAARTIRNERERNATAMLAPFMPCGAKLPVIALFSGAFFEDASWVGTLMYFVGIVLILLGALLVNKIAGHKNRKSFFIMELPEYKTPSVKRACMSMLSRGWSYIVKAGTIILLCNAAVYIMQSFDWSFRLVEEGMEHTSILASIAGPIAVVLVPIIGITAWQMAAASVTGFIAKENVVGTLAVCYGISNLIDTDALELVEGAGAAVADQFGITAVAALAFLMFNLFTPPCFAAMGAMNAEIKDKKWLFGGIGLQLGTGYSVGYLVYTIGTLITAPATLNVTAAIGGGLFVVAFGCVLTALCLKSDKQLKAEYALSGKK
jgi:ferrous iron transport protein B